MKCSLSNFFSKFHTFFKVLSAPKFKIISAHSLEPLQAARCKGVCQKWYQKAMFSKQICSYILWDEMFENWSHCEIFQCSQVIFILTSITPPKHLSNSQWISSKSPLNFQQTTNPLKVNREPMCKRIEKSITKLKSHVRKNGRNKENWRTENEWEENIKEK